MSDPNAGSEQLPLLIMLPYAGGSAQAYYPLGARLRDTALVRSVEYAGHGRRFRSALAKDFSSLTKDTLEQTAIVLSGTDAPFWLFGHSMGGIVAASITSTLQKQFPERMRGLILSSCLPPNRLKERTQQPTAKTDLLDYLCTERNIPRQLVETHEFLSYIFPAVQNDFRILNELRIFTPEPLLGTVHGICASLDYGIRRSDMEHWQQYAECPIRWHSAPGTHFYFEEHEADAARLLESILLENNE